MAAGYYLVPRKFNIIYMGKNVYVPSPLPLSGSDDTGAYLLHGWLAGLFYVHRSLDYTRLGSASIRSAHNPLAVPNRFSARIDPDALFQCGSYWISLNGLLVAGK
jgi:hypothetical protein